MTRVASADLVARFDRETVVARPINRGASLSRLLGNSILIPTGNYVIVHKVSISQRGPAFPESEPPVISPPPLPLTVSPTSSLSVRLGGAVSPRSPSRNFSATKPVISVFDRAFSRCVSDPEKSANGSGGPSLVAAGVGRRRRSLPRDRSALSASHVHTCPR